MTSKKTSKEALDYIRDRLFDEISYIISKQGREGSLITEYNIKDHEDVYRYVDNILGIDIIRKDLEFLESIKSLLQVRHYGYNEIDIYSLELYTGHFIKNITQEEYFQFKEVLEDER